MPLPNDDWSSAYVHMLATTDPDAPGDDLAPLLGVIGDAHIVGLGESTHGTHEFQEAKDRLLRHLVTHGGATVFAIEANMPEARAVDHYIQTGEGDPTALVRGMGFWTWDTQEVVQMVRWMREYRAGGGAITFAGFDSQDPHVAAETLRGWLAENAPEWSERVVTPPAFVASGNRLSLAATAGHTVKQTGWVRTAAELGRIGLWCRADRGGRTAAFDNLASRQIGGTRGWQRWSVSIVVPVDAEGVECGTLLSGFGDAWFDDITITADGSPVPYVGDFEADPDPRVTTDVAHGGTHSLHLQNRLPDPRSAETLYVDLRDAAPRWSATLPGVDWIVQCARIVAQSAAIVSADGMEEGSRIRDAAMADNVDWLLGQEPPGTRIVLWAHDDHLTRRRDWAPSMGLHLADRHGADYFPIAFLTGYGHYRARLPGDRDAVGVASLGGPALGSPEAWLSHRAPLALVDLLHGRAAASAPRWVQSASPKRDIGAVAMAWPFQWSREAVADDFDAVFWARSTTATVPTSP